jgi:hypothetical protein
LVTAVVVTAVVGALGGSVAYVYATGARSEIATEENPERSGNLRRAAYAASPDAVGPRHDDQNVSVLSPSRPDARPPFGGQLPIATDTARTLISSPRSFFAGSELVVEHFLERRGVRVVRLDGTSVAALVGVREGDLILICNGVPAESVAVLSRRETWLEFAEHGIGSVLVLRGDAGMHIEYAVPVPFDRP